MNWETSSMEVPLAEDYLLTSTSDASSDDLVLIHVISNKNLVGILSLTIEQARKLYTELSEHLPEGES